MTFSSNIAILISVDDFLSFLNISSIYYKTFNGRFLQLYTFKDVLNYFLAQTPISHLSRAKNC